MAKKEIYEYDLREILLIFHSIYMKTLGYSLSTDLNTAQRKTKSRKSDDDVIHNGQSVTDITDI